MWYFYIIIILYLIIQFPWSKIILSIGRKTSFYQRELFKLTKSIETTNFEGISKVILAIPDTGISQESILDELSTIQGDSNSGKNSGAIYISDPKLDELITKVTQLTMRTNPLHVGLSPMLRKLETEIVAMVGSLFHGDTNVRGNVTTGGSSSIQHAVYTARQRAKVRGLYEWNIIIPNSAHPAFDKAGEMFNVKVNRIPVNQNLVADIDKMKDAIDKNTILIVGSFPSFPFGMIDPIEQLSHMLDKIDPTGNIGLHIDACLGGFVLPWTFTELLGFDIKRVTSISADTHKYGYDKKGSSVILYRNEDWYRHQIFVQTTWSGGIYTSPTFEGSRAGCNIATAWAAINYIGKDRYTRLSKRILETAQEIITLLSDHEYLAVIGEPVTMVVGIRSINSDVNIYNVLEEMKKKGWYLNSLQYPAGFHICITAVHIEQDNFSQYFVQELNECVEIVLNSEYENGGDAKIYGTNATLGMNMFVEDIAREYWIINARVLPCLLPFV